MRPDEQLREKFDVLVGEKFPARVYVLGKEYREELWTLFLAGANAAMDMQFAPGAVRFGPSFTVMQSTDPQPGDTPLTNPFAPHCEHVDIEDFVRLPDLGGES